MSVLDELLQADAQNTVNFRQGLHTFDPALSEALDRAAEMFNTFGRCMEGTVDESEECRLVEKCAQELGVQIEEVSKMLEATGNDRPVLREAREAFFRMWARRAKAIIYLLLQRNYMWGTTDLLRMRLTAAAGYCRLEAEAIGLLLLIQDDPTIGRHWWKIITDRKGKAFFNEIQERLKNRLRTVGLDSAYDHGSGVAQHVRAASAALGLSLSDTHARLVYQEVREDDLFGSVLAVLSFLSVQVHVFRALTEAFPNVDNSLWQTDVEQFTRHMAQLWEKLEVAFPTRCKEMRDREPR